VSWRKFLLVPRLARTGLVGGRAPSAHAAWEGYWRDVTTTGAEGEVLWDGAGEAELTWWRGTARAHLDRTLPVVDVGAGNGRLSRLLAEDFPAVLGVDLSEAAVERARQESLDVPRVSFEALDVTAEGAGERLLAQVGPANVVVRGVFHVLDADGRQRAAAELARVVAGRGTLVLLETNWQGDLLGYLEHLGGRDGRLPGPLARLIDYRLPRPAAFGAREVAETFPAATWTTVESGSVDIAPVRGLGTATGRTIPGFYAALRAPVEARTTADDETSRRADQGV
jgi:SAM-dependent methyltransferase